VGAIRAGARPTLGRYAIAPPCVPPGIVLDMTSPLAVCHNPRFAKQDYGCVLVVILARPAKPPPYLPRARGKFLRQARPACAALAQTGVARSSQTLRPLEGASLQPLAADAQAMQQTIQPESASDGEGLFLWRRSRHDLVAPLRNGTTSIPSSMALGHPASTAPSLRASSLEPLPSRPSSGQRPHRIRIWSNMPPRALKFNAQSRGRCLAAATFQRCPGRTMRPRLLTAAGTVHNFLLQHQCPTAMDRSCGGGSGGSLLRCAPQPWHTWRRASFLSPGELKAARGHCLSAAMPM